MTIAVAPPLPTQATGPAVPTAAPSPTEYVRSLSPEDKQAVFLVLLREALALNGDTGLLPIDELDGTPFGYYVPPKAAAAIFEKYGPKLTPEEDAEMLRRTLTPGDSIPFEQMIAELKAMDPAEFARQAQ